MNSEDEAKAKQLIKALLESASTGFPIEPLTQDDSNLVSKYLKSQGKTMKDLARQMDSIRPGRMY